MAKFLTVVGHELAVVGIDVALIITNRKINLRTRSWPRTATAHGRRRRRRQKSRQSEQDDEKFHRERRPSTHENVCICGEIGGA